ncbi:MAG: hypothetical protein IAG13_38350, partial [Deltaproteobacteria bacterium]|nr:hypothetical protein [Nannocystaceae bacterium]
PVQLAPASPEVPQHDPKMLGMGGDEAVRTVAAEGSMSAAVDGVATTFTFLPFGSNVAAWSEHSGVARVVIAGAPTDRGFPMLRIVLENVRLDRLQLPASFAIGGGGKADAPRARIEYMREERKSWLAEAEGPAAGTVTLEGYTGKHVRGTFSATLTPRSSAFGPPIDVTNGRFDVALRLQGVEPGPAAP